MTPEEAIKQLEFDREMILFNPSTGYPIPLEIVKAQNNENYLTYLADGVAIEALEKQTPKKCIIDSCPDHTHYKCPSCGKIQLSIYAHGFPRLGRITKYCENCGQALIDNNLEEI